VRGYTADERWALGVLSGPPGDFDAHEPVGARLEAAMLPLIERGCVRYRRFDDDAGTSFGLTDLGRLAFRLVTRTP
jgi:hypothetical protein